MGRYQTCLMMAALALYSVIATASPLASIDNAQRDTALHRDHLTVFKDWILSRCIATAYQGEAAASADAAATASGYLEFGNFDMDHAGSYQAMIDRHLSRSYVGSPDTAPADFNLMKCIDLYHSHELDALARMHVAKPTRTFAQDNPTNVK